MTTSARSSSPLTTFLLTLAWLSLGACCTRPSSPSPGATIGSLDVPPQLPAGVHEVLRSATEFELFAVHPYPHSIQADGLQDAEQLDGFAILGQVTVLDETLRRDVVSVLYSGVEASDGSLAMCFNPRHALHASAGGRELELLICYECLTIKVKLDGKVQTVPTAEAARVRLSKLWRAAGLTVHANDN